MKGKLICHKTTSRKQLRNMCLPFFTRFLQTDKLIVATATGMRSIKSLFIHRRFRLQNHHKRRLRVLMLQVRPCGETIKKWYHSPSISWVLMLLWQRPRCYTLTFVSAMSKHAHICHICDLKKFKSVTLHFRESGISRFCFSVRKWSDLNFPGSQFQANFKWWRAVVPHCWINFILSIIQRWP